MQKGGRASRTRGVRAQTQVKGKIAKGVGIRQNLRAKKMVRSGELSLVAIYLRIFLTQIYFNPNIYIYSINLFWPRKLQLSICVFLLL